jgi:dephospho-CoA kinase
MIKIGITGGIGSGKSTITKIFSLLEVPVYDADSRAKWLQNNDSKLIKSTQTLLGEEAYKDGKLNSTYILSKIFKNSDLLAQLNSLVHPRVFEDFADWCQQNSAKPYILKEAAIMFESDSYKTLDKIILVTSPMELRIKRILERDPQRTEADVKAIISRQLSDEEKIAKADFIIENDEKKLLMSQVLELHKKFLSF